MTRLIVKVQISLATNLEDKRPRVLMYTQDRKTICMEGVADPMMLAIMRGEPKLFHYVEIENGVPTLKGEAPWQDW